MRKSAFAVLMVIAWLCLMWSLSLAGGEQLGYLSPDKINSEIKNIADANKDVAKFRIIGQTPGGRDIPMLELSNKDSKAPAIFVVANMEGNSPIGCEAAIRLSRLLTTDWKAELDTHRWYIVPLGNPDGYANFFATPLTNNYLNDRPVNEDNDNATDEDGPDDLNKDGFITQIRQLHPEGRWIKIEGSPVLMKQAERGKGEKGEYRLFTEGIDNDGDGKINEDGPGGCNPGYNFPHAFEHYTKTDGMWAASETESRAILEFAFAHPEIAMLLTFGRSNSLLNVPESNKKATGTGGTYKLPKRMAKNMGVDPEQEFTMPELIEMGKEATGMQDLTEEMVLQFLGVGAAVNPDRNDLPYWNEISEKYKEFIKEAGLEEKRLKPRRFPTGSIEEWSYFQYGIPTFAMDFWTLPEPKKEEEKKEEGGLTPEEVEKMTNEEFIALGEEKIDAFLKASGAPAQFQASMVIQGLQGGMMTTKRMAEMMRKMKKSEEAGGADETEEALYTYNPEAFVQWQEYDHPTLGKVEIGGMKPYSTIAPPLESIEELIGKQLPFVRELAQRLPKINIEKVDIEKRGSDVWKVEVWIANNGFLPYPTHQGNRCQRPTPAIATLTGESVVFLEGKTRNVLNVLEGSGGNQKVSWLIQASEGKSVTLKTFSEGAGEDERRVVLRGGGQ